MKVVSFIFYYLNLRATVLLGIRLTTNPLSIKWRWRHYKAQYKTQRGRELRVEISENPNLLTARNFSLNRNVVSPLSASAAAGSDEWLEDAISEALAKLDKTQPTKLRREQKRAEVSDRGVAARRDLR